MDRAILELIDAFVNDVSFAYAGDPLDGDDTELISKRILIELDMNNGNITSSEYAVMIGKLEREENGG